MSRKILGIINNDRILIDLRMQSEDLINNIDRIDPKEFEKESLRIKSEIDNRISQIYKQNENIK